MGFRYALFGLAAALQFALATLPAYGDTGPGTVLWQIQGPHGPSYLLGTIHRGIPLAALPPVVLEKFRESGTFVQESDLGGHLDPEAIWLLSRLPSDQNLETMLEPAHWAKLKQLLVPRFRENFLRSSKPWLIARLIDETGPTAADHSGTTQSPEMDRQLFSLARERGKRYDVLEETIDALKATDEASTLAESLEDLTKLLDHPEDHSTQPGAGGTISLELYLSGDLTAMKAVIFQDQSDRALKYYEAVRYQRSRNWLPKIERLIRDGGSFIAVGLGHLLGDQSVIALLRQKGYTVTQPPLPQPLATP